jgi:SMODS-associated and fused to various effectors sensor domain
VIAQGWLEALIDAGWEVAFGRPAGIPDVPPAYGVFLVVVGVSVFLWPRTERHPAAQRPDAIVIRHQSMEPLARLLDSSALPSSLATAEIHRIDIDQAVFYSAGVLDNPAAAVRQQRDLATRVRALLHAKPGSEVFYHGKAHVPLVFLAGHALSTGIAVHFHELDRHGGDWLPVDETDKGDDLGLQVTPTGDMSARDVVVRIGLSYRVDTADVREAVSSPYGDFEFSIAQPRVDAIETSHQIEVIAAAFRQVLDDLKGQTQPPDRIHVFYAGPMSVAFSLGRQISPTIHPPVWVYNFSAKTIPRYAWGLHVNGGGPPESLIRSCVAAGA